MDDVQPQQVVLAGNSSVDRVIEERKKHLLTLVP